MSIVVHEMGHLVLERGYDTSVGDCKNFKDNNRCYQELGPLNMYHNAFFIKAEKDRDGNLLNPGSVSEYDSVGGIAGSVKGKFDETKNFRKDILEQLTKSSLLK